MNIPIQVSYDPKKLDRALALIGRPDVIKVQILKLALNDSLIKGRTLVRRAIQQRYTFPPAYINDDKKGLKLKFLTSSNLTGTIGASNRPVSLSDVKTSFRSKTIGHSLSTTKKGKAKHTAMKRSVGLVTVQILKEGKGKEFKTAFAPGRFSYKSGGNSNTKAGAGMQSATPAIFMRGKYMKGGKFVSSKSRFPITAVRTTSIGTAARNSKTKKLYENELKAYSEKRFIHHLNRYMKKVETK